VGTGGSTYEVPCRHCFPPQNPNPIREGGLQRQEAPPVPLAPPSMTPATRCVSGPHRPRHCRLGVAIATPLRCFISPYSGAMASGNDGYKKGFSPWSMFIPSIYS